MVVIRIPPITMRIIATLTYTCCWFMSTTAQYIVQSETLVVQGPQSTPALDVSGQPIERWQEGFVLELRSYCRPGSQIDRRITTRDITGSFSHFSDSICLLTISLAVSFPVSTLTQFRFALLNRRRAASEALRAIQLNRVLITRVGRSLWPTHYRGGSV